MQEATEEQVGEETLRALAAEEPQSSEDSALAVDELIGEERFVVDTESRAEWAVNKLLGYDAEIARVQAQAQIRLKDLQSRREWFWERFSFDLREWLAGELKKRKGKKRSVDLLAGRLGFRKTSGGLRFKDADAALAWAKEQEVEGLTRTKPAEVQLDREGVREHFKKTGEIPPGCDLTEDTDKLSIDAPKG